MCLYNGYEHKNCSISPKGVHISSESMLTNQELTKYYRALLKEVLAIKKQQEVAETISCNQ